MDLHVHVLVFSMLIWIISSWSSAFLCSDADIIFLFPFIVIPSMTAISSLKDQYDCVSFCTSAFVDGLPCNMFVYLCTQHLWSPAIFLLLLMQSGTSKHVSHLCLYPFFTSLHPWCLDSQSAGNNCEPDLYRILLLYWWMYSSILSSVCDRFTTSLLTNLVMRPTQ